MISVLRRNLVIITIAFLWIRVEGNSNLLENEINSHERCVNEKKHPVCISSGCVSSASAILKTIDEAVDPCDNFYEFACGTFIKNAIIPEDELSVMKNVEIQNRVIQQLRDMVEEPTHANESKPFQLLKHMYNICMDTEAIEEKGLTVAKTYLKDIGGWPVLEGKNWDENAFEWKNMTYKIRKTGFYHSGFITMFISSDVYNATRNILIFDEGNAGLNKRYLTDFNNEIVQAYYNYMVDTAIEYGADPDVAKKEIKDVVEFQIKFANISLPSEQRRNITSLTNQFTMGELQRKFPNFPWLEFANNVINNPNVTITADELVDVGVPSFIPKLELLLKQTPKRIQANYLAWKFIEELSNMLPQNIRDIKFRFNKVLTGVQKIVPRWKECVSAVNSRMNLATAALYVRKYFNEDSKKRVEEMISDMKSTFIHILKDLDWMDDSTRQKAMDKALAMAHHVAYPQELLDNRKIEEFYAELKSSDNYLDFYLNYQKFSINRVMMNLRKPINKTEWIYHASSTAVNAFYSVSENGIELPAGILQDVYFNKDRPQYLNYGAIGFIIAHEITHGFDDQGRQTNKDGLLIDWWTEETAKTFLKKAQCIIDQYSNFTVPNSNVTVNGINTQGENIADNGALKVSYLAYRAWVTRNGKEPYLPGLKYTPNQMFWIALANLWCSKDRPEIVKKMAIMANHSPSNFRVIGSIRNSKYFAHDFNCPIGSNMNPKKKCSVW